jgi:hypothetical protein
MTMRFIMPYNPGREIDGPPNDKGRIGQMIEEIGTDGLQSSSEGERVRISGKKVIVTDGPFAETKELIGG